MAKVATHVSCGSRFLGVLWLPVAWEQPPGTGERPKPESFPRRWPTTGRMRLSNGHLEAKAVREVTVATNKNGQLRQVGVAGVYYHPPSNAPVLLLREEAGERLLPVWVGPREASFLSELAQPVFVPHPRPQTFELIEALLAASNVQVESCCITGEQDQSYLALVTCRRQGESFQLDARPSDAISLALQAAKPIFVTEELLAAASRKWEVKREVSGREEVTLLKGRFRRIQITRKNS